MEAEEKPDCGRALLPMPVRPQTGGYVWCLRDATATAGLRGSGRAGLRWQGFFREVPACSCWA
jgi:hypothetical protein